MRRRVIVTGASGFIGRHVLAPLRRRGFDVHAVSRHARRAPPGTGRARRDDPGEDSTTWADRGSLETGAGRGSLETGAGRGSLDWQAVDLLAEGAPAELAERLSASHLLHLAWEATPGLFWNSPDNAQWQRASVALCEAFARSGGRRLVAVGSGAEYDWRAGRCVEATTPLRPTTAYSRSKDALRRSLAERWGEDGEAADAGTGAGDRRSWAWARLFWQFGPGEATGRLVPSVIEALLDGREATCSSGVQRRDFLYVADVGEALAALVDGEVRGCVNIGAGQAIAVGELARRVAAACGRPEGLRLGARRGETEEPPLVEADVRRLRDEVGFEPSWSLDEAIAATVDWWRGERASDRAGEHAPQRGEPGAG